MYSDLLDVLGGGNSLAGGSNRRENEKHVAVSFLAGKMDMALQEVRSFAISLLDAIIFVLECVVQYSSNSYSRSSQSATFYSFLPPFFPAEWQVLGDARHPPRHGPTGVAGFTAQVGMDGPSRKHGGGQLSHYIRRNF